MKFHLSYYCKGLQKSLPNGECGLKFSKVVAVIAGAASLPNGASKIVFYVCDKLADKVVSLFSITI